MTNLNYRIRCGFYKEEKTIEMSIQEAYRMLLTDKRYKYIKVINKNGEASLFQHILTCPHCGNQFVACTHDVTKSEIANSDISNWVVGQLSFFEGEEQSVCFCPENNEYECRCGECGYKASVSEDFRTVSVCGDNLAIKVTCELKNSDEVMCSPCFNFDFSKSCFPLYETIEFNLEEGISTIYIKDAKGITLAFKDITKDYKEYQSGVLFELIAKNSDIRGNIKQLFEMHWDVEFPFHEIELSLEKYIMVTAFVGYPRSFYDVIPYEIDSLKISESFEFDKRLKNSSEIVKVYKNSALPDVKSVRSIFFKNPGLFFFAKECKIIWDIIADVNIFCQVLSENRIFEVLYNLHTYPGIAVFYSDYCNIVGVKKLCAVLNENPEILVTEAVKYYAMNDWQKSKERQKWAQNRHCFDQDNGSVTPDFSVLMNIGENPVVCALVDGFSFNLLHTFKEYVQAGKKLKNCLTDWNSRQNPVVAIYKNNCIIAAAELEGNEVLQVRCAENKSIEKNKALLKAFKKWCKMYDFVYENYLFFK